VKLVTVRQDYSTSWKVTAKNSKKYQPEQLTELAEASTSIGLPMGIQGKKGRSRPIYGLFFYNEPLAVAVQVGSNGFCGVDEQEEFGQFGGEKFPAQFRGGGQKAA